MRRMDAQKRKFFRKVKIYSLVSVIVFMSLLPFYTMLLSAFSPNELQKTFPPLIFFRQITLGNFRYVFDPQLLNFLHLLRNSLIVSLIPSLISVFVGILGGYSAARFRFFGRSLILHLILLVYMFTGVLLVIPLFKILSDLKIVNTHIGLMLPYLVLTIPLALYLCTNYFRSLPSSVEDSALLDGCSYFTLIWRIVVPMSMPAIVAVFLFTFILIYNEYLFASIILKSESLYTIPYGIHRFWQGTASGQELWGYLNAATFLACVPILVIYSIIHRYMIKGLIMGAEKG